MNQKKLIRYFSWLVNTDAIAKLIQQETGAELFEIVTIKPYPVNCYQTRKAAKDDLKKNARPELTKAIKILDNYKLFTLVIPR